MVLVVAAVAGSAVFGLAAAYAQGPATTYTVTHVVVDGARDSAQAVKHANKTASGVDSGHHEVSLDADATSAEILAAADALSTHSITTGSRYIDAGGEVHNFRSGKRTYWLIVKRDTTPTPTPTPMPTPTPTPTPTPAPVSDPDTTYTVTHVRVDGARDSAQAVKDANKTASGVSSGNHEFDLAADATTADILAAANARSTHSITTGSRYIDASGNVHNFQGGKRTYWLITKSEVNVVEPDPDPDRQNVGVNQLTLTGTIADQQLSQGVLYTSATAFPEATGIDGTVTYSVANLPSGIMLNSDRKLTGTPISHLEVTEFTYTATDSDGDTATLTFNLSVLIDYDADNDGLIEVKSLAQLNAIRWDLDGDGVADHAYMQADYAAAFPYPLSGMGCPGTGCKGYELDNDLDFDTNGDGKTNIAGDDYWGDDRGNDSRGWQPIGDRRVPFTAVFDGNDYGISKLYVYKNSSNLAGLFGRIAAGGGYSQSRAEGWRSNRRRVRRRAGGGKCRRRHQLLPLRRQGERRSLGRRTGGRELGLHQEQLFHRRGQRGEQYRRPGRVPFRVRQREDNRQLLGHYKQQKVRQRRRYGQDHH